MIAYLNIHHNFKKLEIENVHSEIIYTGDDLDADLLSQYFGPDVGLAHEYWACIKGEIHESSNVWCFSAKDAVYEEGTIFELEFAEKIRRISVSWPDDPEK